MTPKCATRSCCIDFHTAELLKKSVVIDPRVAFGRPVLVGTGIPTAILAERFKAGELLKDLATDYGADEEKIQEAIRCELGLAA